MIHKILLAANLDADAERRLANAANVIRADNAEIPLSSLVGDCDALIGRTNTLITAEVLRAGRRLRVVGVAGVGLDNVDLDAANQLGIHVLHVPDAASDAVAELTVSMMLQLIRPTTELRHAYQAGRFHEARAVASGRELRELCVGVVGLGRIGSRVARICNVGFGTRVLFNDILTIQPAGFQATAVSKEELWSAADVITLHLPLTPLTRGLISENVLRQFPPGAILINAARGAIVDTAAMTAALQSGRLGGVGLDVTDPEPLPPDHPLFKLPNCLLTPHIASRTPGGLQRMFGIVEMVLDYLSRTPPR